MSWFTLHPLVRDWLQLRLSTNKQREYSWEALEILGATEVTSVRFSRNESYLIGAELCLHLESLCKNYEADGLPDLDVPETHVDVLRHLVWFVAETLQRKLAPFAFTEALCLNPSVSVKNISARFLLGHVTSSSVSPDYIRYRCAGGRAGRIAGWARAGPSSRCGRSACGCGGESVGEEAEKEGQGQAGEMMVLWLKRCACLSAREDLWIASRELLATVAMDSINPVLMTLFDFSYFARRPARLAGLVTHHQES